MYKNTERLLQDASPCGFYLICLLLLSIPDHLRADHLAACCEKTCQHPNHPCEGSQQRHSRVGLRHKVHAGDHAIDEVRYRSPKDYFPPRRKADMQKGPMSRNRCLKNIKGLQTGSVTARFWTVSSLRKQVPAYCLSIRKSC